MSIRPFPSVVALVLAASAVVAMGMQSVGEVQQIPVRRVSAFSPPYPPEELEVIPVDRHAQFAAPVVLGQGERFIVIGWNGQQHHPGLLFPLPLVQQPTSDNWIPDPARRLSAMGAPFDTLVLDGPGSWVFATSTSAGEPSPNPGTEAYLLGYRVRTD